MPKAKFGLTSAILVKLSRAVCFLSDEGEVCSRDFGLDALYHFAKVKRMAVPFSNSSLR